MCESHADSGAGDDGHGRVATRKVRSEQDRQDGGQVRQREHHDDGPEQLKQGDCPLLIGGVGQRATLIQVSAQG